MLDWLAAALNSNGERIKMRPNAAKACTDGFAINLAGVREGAQGTGGCVLSMASLSRLPE